MLSNHKLTAFCPSGCSLFAFIFKRCASLETMESRLLPVVLGRLEV
ncbi:uncharacterized protein METZ01_LOCUS299928, partial [marine metagenome]